MSDSQQTTSMLPQFLSVPSTPSTSEAPSKTIVVICSESIMGSQIVRHLLPKYKIIAIVHNTDHPESQLLQQQGAIIVPLSSTLDRVALDKILAGVHGVCYMSPHCCTSMAENLVGQRVIESCVAQQVKHLIYLSMDGVDYAHSASSIGNASSIITGPYEAKRKVEQGIKETASKLTMIYTIFRMTGIMDDLAELIMNGYYHLLKGVVSKKHPSQFVSISDIAEMVKRAFDQPDQFQNRTMVLVGDSLTRHQIKDVYEKTSGEHLWTQPTHAPMFHQISKENLDILNTFRWFKLTGFSGNVQECKQANPKMTSFECFLKAKFDKRGKASTQ